MSVTVEQLKQQQTIKQRNQNKDLLLNVRAKAFELQTVLSDLIEFGKDSEQQKVYELWMSWASEIYDDTGRIVKGA